MRHSLTVAGTEYDVWLGRGRDGYLLHVENGIAPAVIPHDAVVAVDGDARAFGNSSGDGAILDMQQIAVAPASQPDIVFGARQGERMPHQFLHPPMAA